MDFQSKVYFFLNAFVLLIFCLKRLPRPSSREKVFRREELCPVFKTLRDILLVESVARKSAMGLWERSRCTNKFLLTFSLGSHPPIPTTSLKVSTKFI